MKHLVIAALAASALFLSACATNAVPAGSSAAAPAPSAATQNPVQQIAQFTVADLQAADVDAVANNDTIAHACYPALEQFVQGLPTSNSGTTVSGAFSAFQKARDLRNTVASGVPAYLTMGCGPLYAQVHADLLTFLAGGLVSSAPLP